jgi:subfamily B ATP-binding cassette protein MsbA
LSVLLLSIVGLQFASLTIGSVGVFLFAMFRLSPRVSTLNDLTYPVETDIPHVIRSQQFIEEMAAHEEERGDQSPPIRT